jgi:hypothetical protein
MITHLTIEGVWFAMSLLIFGLALELLGDHRDSIARFLVGSVCAVYATVSMGMIAGAWLGTFPPVFNFNSGG